MPTYEYECDKCGHRFEQFQGITAKPLHKCPKCGKSTLRRLIGTGAGLIFKGSGFYATDYRSEQYKQAAKKDLPAATPAAGPTKAGSETKAAAKPETKSTASAKAS